MEHKSFSGIDKRLLKENRDFRLINKEWPIKIFRKLY